MLCYLQFSVPCQNTEMQQMLDGREAFQDKDGIILSLDNDLGLGKDNHLCSTASEFRTEFRRMLSQKLCSCDSKMCLADNVNFISAAGNFFQEHGTSDSINMFRSRASVHNIPSKLRSSEFLFKNLKHHRRTRSINYLSSFIFQCPCIVGSGNILIGPSGKWILDSIEGTLLKSSLFFNLAAIDDTMSHVMARSVIYSQTKASELTCPPETHKTSVQESKADIIPFEKHRSEMIMPEQMLMSCSSTNSSSLYQSTSSLHSSFSKGLLHCMWKSGTPYFVFSVDNDHGDVFVTNSQKMESSVDKALDYVYLFHSKKAIRGDPRNHGNGKLDYVGKMKVSSSLVLNSDMSTHSETEFVLVGTSEGLSVEMQSSSSNHTKSKGFSKKVAEIFRPSHSTKHRPTSRIGESSSQSDETISEPFLCELCDFSELDSVSHLNNDFSPNLELAAIVVKDYPCSIDKEASLGGWGLKFLEKARDVNTSQTSHSHKEISTGKERECERSINVLVPAGVHGGPSAKTGGPSSLTNRWRSGGQCDCGGWDVGCPLTILNDTSNYSKTLNQEESPEDCKIVSLFTKGTKDGEPVLRVVSMNEGLHCIYFQSTLSVLQSFAIAVAIIHTMMPALQLKL